MNKVIAICDAPLTSSGYIYNDIYYQRAYYRGDIFEVYQWTELGLIILHDKLEIVIDVDPQNFITLDEWRQERINQVVD